MAKKPIQGAGSSRKKKRRQNPQPQPVVQQTVVVQQASAPQASDDPNSLFSKASVRLIDVLSEGEIEGFVTADEEKSIYLDDTPLIAADGSKNIVFDSFEFRAGTQGQQYIPGFVASEGVTSVNAAIGDTVGSEVVRTITDNDVDAVIVRVVIPQLFKVGNGLKASSMEYDIDIQSFGGSYETKVAGKVNGKCTSPYERSHRIELTGVAPWNIKLKRTVGEHDGTTDFRQLTFGGFTELIDGKLRYPLTACVGLRFEATQFQSVPTRAYDIKGIKVQIPSNATVDSTNGRLSYSGIWDGSFQTAWCADPAWIMRDLLLSERYGLGRFVSPAQCDKWSLYEVSKYCNTLVNDGEGGQEPRFLCNVYMQSRDEAYNVIQDFASVFRGMAYWSAGQIAFTQDRPSDPAVLFTNSNVVNGDFVYEGSSLKARHTVALVTWNDPTDGYEQKVEYVADDAAIAKWGVIETRVAAFGCTSRGQANRVGRWLLYQEQNETETCTFKVGLDGAILRPGQIVKVADRMRAGVRKGGRIASATSTVLTLDEGQAVTPGDTVTVVFPDATVEQRTISDGDVSAKTVTVSAAFSQTPATQSLYVIETDTVEAQLFRVLSVVEDEETFTVVCLEHNSGKYAHVEDGLALQQRDISVLNEPPDAPSGISVDERLIEISNKVVTEITVSWSNVPRATAYQISLKTDSSISYKTLGDTPYNNYTLTTEEFGVFTFRVVAISPIGKRSAAADFTATIAGLTAAPGNVQNLSMVPVNGQARLTWDQSADLDVRVGGHVQIRHSPDLSGVDWADTVTISAEVAGAATEVYCDLKEGTYLAKFVDASGVESLSAALSEFVEPDLDNIETISTLTEHPSFAGTKSNLTVNTGLNELELSSAGSGTYETSGTYTLGAITLSDIFSVSLKSTLKVRSYFPSAATIDTFADFDAISDFDGLKPSGNNVQLQIRTSQVSSGSNWSSWHPFNNAQFKARRWQARALVTSTDNTSQMAISQLQIKANLPWRTVSNSVTTSASADVAVTYANKFYATPAIGVQFTTQSTGDYYVISNSAATGFSISVYDSSNARVARAVTWTATGYGKN